MSASRSGIIGGWVFRRSFGGCWRNTGASSMGAMFGTDGPPVDESRRWRWRRRGRCTWGVAPGWEERTPLASGSRGNDSQSGMGLRRAPKAHPHSSLGQRPRKPASPAPALKARLISPATKHSFPGSGAFRSPQLVTKRASTTFAVALYEMSVSGSSLIYPSSRVANQRRVGKIAMKLGVQGV